jgi:hypothetical protein
MEMDLKLTHFMPAEAGAGIVWGGEAFGALMTYRGVDARPGDAAYSGLKILDTFLRPDAALAFYDPTTGEWGDCAGGRVMSPWRTTKPSLDAEGGSNGRGAVVATSSTSNPGVLLAPVGTLQFREDTDQTFLTIIDPGTTAAAGKTILAGDQYDGQPYWSISTANRIQADLRLSAGAAVQSGSNAVAEGRWNAVWWFWNATSRSLAVGRRDGTVLASTTMPDDEDNHVLYPRAALFGCPERDTVEEPALTPGSPRVRLPASNMKSAGLIAFNADLRQDSDLMAAAIAYLEAEHAPALAAYT